MFMDAGSIDGEAQQRMRLTNKVCAMFVCGWVPGKARCAGRYDPGLHGEAEIIASTTTTTTTTRTIISISTSIRISIAASWVDKSMPLMSTGPNIALAYAKNTLNRLSCDT